MNANEWKVKRNYIYEQIHSFMKKNKLNELSHDEYKSFTRYHIYTKLLRLSCLIRELMTLITVIDYINQNRFFIVCAGIFHTNRLKNTLIKMEITYNEEKSCNVTQSEAENSFLDPEILSSLPLI